jgi:mRNA interferase HigB
VECDGNAMHVITRKRLNEFAATHPMASSALQHWYKLMKSGAYHSFAELRNVFPSADQVGKLTVFNIGGNTARLIAAIHYNRQRVYIRAILTHQEYDQGKWKE